MYLSIPCQLFILVKQVMTYIVSYAVFRFSKPSSSVTAQTSMTGHRLLSRLTLEWTLLHHSEQILPDFCLDIQQRLQRIQSVDYQMRLVLDRRIQRRQRQTLDHLSRCQPRPCPMSLHVPVSTYQVLILHQGQEVDNDRRNQLIVGGRRVDKGVSNSRGHQSSVMRGRAKQILRLISHDTRARKFQDLPGAWAGISQERQWSICQYTPP